MRPRCAKVSTAVDMKWLSQLFQKERQGHEGPAGHPLHRARRRALPGRYLLERDGDLRRPGADWSTLLVFISRPMRAPRLRRVRLVLHSRLAWHHTAGRGLQMRGKTAGRRHYNKRSSCSKSSTGFSVTKTGGFPLGLEVTNLTTHPRGVAQRTFSSTCP